MADIRCPKCGDAPTHQTPDGTYWDGNAHSWRLPKEPAMSEHNDGGALKRIQLKRTKGWRMPPNTVKVDRSTRWGNPWPIGEWGPGIRMALDAIGAVGLFRQMTADAEMRGWAGYPADLSPLSGKNLACWCSIDHPCHADVLLELANQPIAERAKGRP